MVDFFFSFFFFSFFLFFLFFFFGFWTLWSFADVTLLGIILLTVRST